MYNCDAIVQDKNICLQIGLFFLAWEFFENEKKKLYKNLRPWSGVNNSVKKWVSVFTLFLL